MPDSVTWDVGTGDINDETMKPPRLGTVHELTNIMDKTVETSQTSLVLYFMDSTHIRLVGFFDSIKFN